VKLERERGLFCEEAALAMVYLHVELVRWLGRWALGDATCEARRASRAGTKVRFVT
jgi:hypothetical protein